MSNKVRRLAFEASGFEIDVRPALGLVNRLFRQMVELVLRPYHFAAQSGKLSDETARRLLAQIYAESVIIGSPTPAFAGFGLREWEQWLVANPEKLDAIRQVAENPASWGLDARYADNGEAWPELPPEADDGDPGLPNAGPADGEGDPDDRAGA